MDRRRGLLDRDIGEPRHTHRYHTIPRIGRPVGVDISRWTRGPDATFRSEQSPHMLGGVRHVQHDERRCHRHSIVGPRCPDRVPVQV